MDTNKPRYVKKSGRERNIDGYYIIDTSVDDHDPDSILCFIIGRRDADRVLVVLNPITPHYANAGHVGAAHGGGQSSAAALMRKQGAWL